MSEGGVMGFAVACVIFSIGFKWAGYEEAGVIAAGLSIAFSALGIWELRSRDAE